MSSPIYDKPDVFYEESGMSKTVAAEWIFDHFFEQYFEISKAERNVFQELKER